MSVEKNITPTPVSRPSQAVADHIAPQGISRDAVPLQRQAVTPAATSTSVSPPVSSVPGSNDTGMPDQLKSGVEYLSGMDLSGVKVHYNSDKPAQLEALAYAQGNDIHLGPGEERHLPHEAWHVVQQRQGRVAATRQLQAGVPVNDDQGLEREAEVMGGKALSVSAPVSFMPSPAGGVSMGPVVQRVDAYVKGNRKKRMRFRALSDGTYKHSATGAIYVYSSGRANDGTLTLKPQRRVRPTPPKKKVTKPTTVRDNKKALRLQKKPVKLRGVSPVRQQQPQRQRQSQPVPLFPVAITFNTLNRVQQEQVLALARDILANQRPGVETHLAKLIVSEEGALYMQASQLYHMLNVPRTPLTSIRDQSKHFDQQVVNINAMIGGSIDKHPGTNIDSKQETEPTFDNGGGLLIDSHYVEANRTADNHVSKGTDNRLVAILETMNNADKVKCRWVLFAYMHLEHGMTLYEVLRSVSSLMPFDQEGIAIYDLIPGNVMEKMGWAIKLSDLLNSEHLTILARALHGNIDELRALVGKVPDFVINAIARGINSLKEGTRRVKEKDTWFASEPDVLVAETSDEDLAAIKQLEQENEDQRSDYYQQLQARFEGNPPAYLLLKMVWGGLYDTGGSGWAAGINTALTAPEDREDGSTLAGPYVSGVSGETLKESIAKISEGLGEYDFGSSVEDKKDEVDALVATDISGAYGINKYISGSYTKISNTLDAPWEVGDQEVFKTVQGAIRGLEALPVYEGWVYRQEKDVQNFVPGEVISPGTLWSAARAPRFGAQFDRQGSGTLYIINSMYTGKDVQLLAGKLKWYQREVLFPPYVRFVVEHRQQHGNNGIAYILKELPPSGPPLTEETLQQAIGTTQLEVQEVKTFIDKSHYDTGIDKYNTSSQWTSQEAFGQGIETLRSGIHHPKELYGLHKFRQWQSVLRQQENVQALGELWTIQGFMSLAKKLLGKNALRDDYSGWGDPNGYELTDPEVLALQQKGLNVNPRFPKSALVDDWEDKLDANWVSEIEDEILNKRYFSCALGDLQALLPALKPGQQIRYDVFYPHSNSGEVSQALTTTLQQYRAGFTNGHQQFMLLLGTGQVNVRSYNRQVAGLAANLQQDLVAIHPFEDGNGRISRMYMYKALQHYSFHTQGLNKLPVIDNTGGDLTSSKDAWAQMLADKVQA
ncbi:DUF4157 domain-containing protein [Chitinophaga pendula]|uniref:eCIS core domain-containing protein n=1 Tax=Chitinophaga TaxID=79328 RepID=UPI000BAFE8D7|nr:MULTISPECIES: DUF4157 domain-containing protein [Chitinophaga]ASZ13457.1 hypothetical protein CK934_22095 [Chitinophaga sp. MD30]UCJ08917.1 DUF4157 domain-containing protein [Chitinophaga pendula]